MDYIVVTGAGEYDGRYEFSLELAGITTVEWGWIKRHAGYLPFTVMDGYQGGDPELYTVFAVMALHRAGKIQQADAAEVYATLARLVFNENVRMEPGDEPAEEADTDPPISASSSVNGGSSGDASKTSSEKSGPARPATGIPASATSESGLPTSVR